MTQQFRRIKIDPSDKLYSEIIRFGVKRCVRCSYVRPLQCAHIMGRGNMGTRWMLKPYRNALPLCADCHSWFDSCKDNTPIFDEEARAFFSPLKNAYAFLVTNAGYTWKDLENLYALAHHKTTKCGAFEKVEIRRQLKEHLKKLTKGEIK
jgi:hypothetical protein